MSCERVMTQPLPGRDWACVALGSEGAVCGGRHQVEVLEQLLQEFVSLFACEIEEADAHVLLVSPTLDVLVVQVVVDAVVGLK